MIKKELLRIALILIFITGCGYKPTSTLSSYTLGEKIFLQIKMSLRDPKNSVVLKDAVREAVITRLKHSLVPKEQAQTQMVVNIQSVRFRPIIYNKNGYVTAYKTYVNLRIHTLFSNKKSDIFISQGEYDFTIQANSVISDNKRYQAIKSASLEALDEYLAHISIKGLSHVKHNQ